jgi:TPR repeat protein
MKKALMLMLILCLAVSGAWAEDLCQNGRDAREAMDYAKALEYFQQAADQGDAEGLRLIGTLYANGEGVEKDFNKALEYYQQAADQGNTKALVNLGNLYRSDNGPGKDIDKAMEYYNKCFA